MDGVLKNKVQFTKKLILILFASFVSAVGINVFFTQHKLISGGVGGIALIIQYLTQIPAGYFILLFNIPLLILSIKEIDMDFTILTIVGTLSQAVFLILTKDFYKYFMLKDMLLSCIYGGVVHGLALGIILSNHGSLGGIDIISIVLRKKYDVDIAKASFGFNLIIITSGAMFFGVETALYTLISVYLGAYVIDKVIKGFNRKKLMFIITEKEDEITSKIKKQLHRSATLLYGEGAYTKRQVKAIYCIVSLSQVPKLKHIIEEIDPTAFVSILDTSEVLGKGFKNGI